MFQSLTRRILNPPAFGLDISDLTVKFSRLEGAGGRTAIGYFGEIDLSPGLVVDGEIKDEQALAAVLKRELKRAGVSYRAAVASLPEEKGFLRVLELPPMKPDDVSKAIRWEVEGVIPMPAEKMIYDFETIPGPPFSGDHLDILVTAFPLEVIQSYERVISQAGLLPVALELESQAISRSLLWDPRAHPPAVLVDLGAARTSFIIFAGGSMLFTKSVAVGGRDFEQAISSALGVPGEEARRLKIEIGLNKRYAQGKVFGAFEPLLQTLAAELSSALWFYRDHPRKTHSALPEIREIILAGGDANLIGLEKYLSLVAKVPVVLGDPFINLGLGPGEIPPIPRNESLKYTTAIGLALRTLGH